MDRNVVIEFIMARPGVSPIDVALAALNKGLIEQRQFGAFVDIVKSTRECLPPDKEQPK